jgi:hypothetical protein
VVERFKSKVGEVLKPSSGDSLFKTLGRMTNLIIGWGKCYRSMRVQETYLRLDEFIKASVESYLKDAGIRLLGKKKGKHMRFLGIRSLASMVEHRKPSPIAARATSEPSAALQSPPKSVLFDGVVSSGCR